MKLSLVINGLFKQFDVDPFMKLRDFLSGNGFVSVRDSDDSEGFCGSDTVLLNGIPVYSNLVMVGELDGCEILTAEGLSDSAELTVVQQAMVDAGIVQSAYNSPAASLILFWLLEKNPNPSKADIKDALSGIFVRDTGYENYYLAVKLAKDRLAGLDSQPVAPSFREELKYVGKPIGKIDSAQLVRGEKSYVEDFVDPHTCYLAVLRSPYASAYINSIDISAAEKLDGVVKVFTAFNTPETYYMQAGQGNPEPSPYDRCLFNKKVRHVGDRVAAVVATTYEIAKKACDLIHVDYEVLPAVFTVDQAMQPGAPLVHNGIVEYISGAPNDLSTYNQKAGDSREGKVIYQFPIHADIRKNIAASNHGSIGNVEKAFKEADAVVDRVYQTSQIQHTPLEPHVCFSKMEGGRLVIYASTQVPYHVRRICALVTGLSENKIHVIKPKVGGGYGSKQDILVEDLCAYAAYATGKPVYSRNTREEEFIANSTRHPMKIHVKMSGKKNGMITGILMEVWANTGPYGNHCLTVPMNSCSKTLPLFKCPNMKYNLKVYYTNTPPAGAYQGYGTPKGNYALMMAMAELAQALKVDYKKMVDINHVEEGYVLDILKGLGEGRDGKVVPVGSCGLSAAIEKGCSMINWGKKEHSKDPDWKIGKGFAMVMQGSGLPGLDHSEAIIKLESDGSVIVNSGGADIGTGLDTIHAKIVAETLLLPMNLITVNSGDTDSCAFDTGAYASSGTFFSGNATVDAVNKLKEMILDEASHQLDEPRSNLSIVEPGVVVSSESDNRLTYAELSHYACSGAGGGQLIAHGSFVTEASSVPYGAHFAQVAVNKKTGEVKVQKFYAIQDAGTPINPELAQCQMYGAVMKSIGHSLYEDMKLNSKGVCLNANMTDYGVPTIFEAPEDFKCELVDVNDQYGPFGAKSISEIACNGAAPAIGIAIHDAVGVWVRSWPMTPEKILREMGKIK